MLGYDYEAVSVDDSSSKYIGKSPGFFNLEIKKGIELCDSNIENLDKIENNYAVRVYSKNL